MHSPGRNSPRTSPHASPRMSAAGGTEAADVGRAEKKLSVKIKAPWGKRRASTHVEREGRVPSSPSPDVGVPPLSPAPFPSSPALPKHVADSPRRASAPLIAVDSRSLIEPGGGDPPSAKTVTPPPALSTSVLTQSPSSPSSGRVLDVQTRPKSGRLTGMLKSRRSINNGTNSAAGVLEVGSAPTTPVIGPRKSKTQPKSSWTPFSKTGRGGAGDDSDTGTPRDGDAVDVPQLHASVSGGSLAASYEVLLLSPSKSNSCELPVAACVAAER